MLISVSGYFYRKNIKPFLWVALIAPPIAGWFMPFGDSPWWIGALATYMVMGVVLLSVAMGRRKEVAKVRTIEPPPFQMMMDDERIVTDNGNMKINMPLEEIVKIIEIQECLVVQSAGGASITLPVGQLLEHEKKLLDEVKSRL
jgi:hypothetical protein